MTNRNHKLSLARQADLLGISRGSLYYQPRRVSEDGPVPFSCRPKCSFRPLSVRTRPGFSNLMLSAFAADCRSH